MGVYCFCVVGPYCEHCNCVMRPLTLPLVFLATLVVLTPKAPDGALG